MAGKSGLTRPTTEALAEFLETKLLSGEWPPGHRLPSERELAQRFSVGRPMVREVLRTLGERGLVVTLPGRGTYVRDIRPSDGIKAREALARRGALTARHLIDARRALESEAAALASVARDAADVRLLGDVVDALESATDFAITAELDLAFHELVTSMSGNPVLEMTFSSMRSLTYALIVRSHADHQVHRTSLPYHRKVFEAVAAGDAAGARRAMELHFTSGQRHYGRDLDVSLAEALRTRADDRPDVADLLRRASSSVTLDQPLPLFTRCSTPLRMGNRPKGDTPVAIAQDGAQSDRAIRYLMDKYTPGGNRIGWLMIASIFIEAWDLYSISFINIFLTRIYHPSALLLGLTSAGTQAGAAVGALIGGWLSDKLGRRVVFLGTMIMFIVFGAAQAFVPNMAMLAAIRFVLGVPLGSDIANGYTYIMEAMPHGKREVMGNRWQFMFAFGEVVAGAVVALMFGAGVAPHILWRVTLGLSAVPAVVLFILRYNLPETAIWLIQRGKFREAKRITMSMYDDPLEMLPDTDVEVPKVRLGNFLADIWSDSVKRRASLFGWIGCVMQSLEFSTFAFYLPILLVLVGVSGILGTDLITIALYVLAAISGLVGPMITPKIGQRRLSIYGFGLVFVALVVAGVAIHTDVTVLVPIAAAGMLWGHYWDAENVMTIPSMVAAPRYKGTASGFAYIFVKLPAFLGIYLFPTFFDAIGKANATLFTALFPLLGLLAALFILREVYGYIEVRVTEPTTQQHGTPSTPA